MWSRINSHRSRLASGLISIVAVVAAIFLPVIGGQTAYASATGCSFSNGLVDPTYYCATISGSGTYVNYVSGTFRGSAVICNYYITAEFFRSNWSWYQTYTSSRTYGCANGAGKAIGIYAYKQPGYMCSTLHYTSGNFGWRAMSVCHQIHY